MIPGWSNTVSEEVPIRFLLPEPYVVMYHDVGFYGRPQTLVTRTVGDPLVSLSSGHRQLTVTMRLLHVYDLALVDRIE